MRRVLAVAALILTAFVLEALGACPPVRAGASVQAIPPATALIAGQIVDGSTNLPVGESVVSLTPNVSGAASPAAREASRRKVLTDGSGRFAFSGLARGRYSLTVDKPGYVAGAFGKITPRGPGTVMELVDGERILDARVLIWKHAVIAGRVLDEANEPVVGVEVRGLRQSSVGGRPGYSDAVTATTDDRGMYRLARLTPGDTFIVAVPSVSVTLPASFVAEFFEADAASRRDLQSAMPTNSLQRFGSQNQQVGDFIVQVGVRAAIPPAAADSAALSVYPTTFYGQVTEQVEATALTLRAGETRTNVDIRVRPVPSVRVSGRIASPDGAAGPIAVRLVHPSTSALANPAFALASGVADRGGDFTLLGVPTGDYILLGTRVSASGETLAVRMPLSVPARDVTGVRAAAARGHRISGRLVTDETSQPLPSQRLGLNFDSRDWPAGDYSEAMAAADGTFTSAELPPGIFTLSVPVPSGWFVKSVTAGGRDIADVPFEVKESMSGVTVVLSRRGASLTGTVRTTAGTPDGSAAVLVFSTEPRQWLDYGPYSRRLRDARTSRTGTFEFRDLPAGDYFIVAMPPAAMTWKPGFLESMSRIATRVTLGEAEQKSTDLRVAEVR